MLFDSIKCEIMIASLGVIKIKKSSSFAFFIPGDMRNYTQTLEAKYVVPFSSRSSLEIVLLTFYNYFTPV